MPKDLRNFIKDYTAKYPDDVLSIDKEISAVQEITAIVMQLEKENRWPILIFHNVLTAEGRRAKQPVITNVLASRSRRARICNSTYQTLGKDVYEASRIRQMDPVVINKTEAPVKEVVKTGDQINLFEFPVVKHNAMDAGLYFSAGFLTTYDPDTGIDNCSIQRGWVKEKDIIRVFVARRPTHNGMNLYKHELKNQDMKVAYWMGHHPLAYIGALTKLPYPGSHWKAAGGMLNEPLRLVASESLGADFLVPADAEVIVEGIIEANKRYAEGPFGEFPGYYGGQIINPQMKVTAITHRKDAFWYNIAAGRADHLGTGGSSLEGQIWEHLKARFPSLKNVYVPESGICRYHAYLQFENPGPEDPRQAIMLALALRPGLIKHVFTFDDDIDIFNEQDVMWAIATRTQWSRDVMIFPHTKTAALDPSASRDVVGDIGGIDCTKPWGETYEERVGIEPEVLERVNLKDYLP